MILVENSWRIIECWKETLEIVLYLAYHCMCLLKKLRLLTCNLFSDLMLVYKLYMSDIRFTVRRICLTLILSSSLLTHFFII